MRVILAHDVPKLGRRGEVREVSDGYARNFLIPRKVAAVATPALVAQYERERMRKVKEDNNAQKEAEKLARRIDGMTVTLSSKASASGTLYAAVGSGEIAEDLQKKGFKVGAGQIEIPKAIKVVGKQEVIVRLPYGERARMQINVIASD